MYVSLHGGMKTGISVHIQYATAFNKMPYVQDIFYICSVYGHKE